MPTKTLNFDCTRHVRDVEEVESHHKLALERFVEIVKIPIVQDSLKNYVMELMIVHKLSNLLS